MSDTNVKIEGGESAAQVAYKLMMEVAGVEGGLRDRKAILDTYAECLHAAKGYRDIPKPGQR